MYDSLVPRNVYNNISEKYTCMYKERIYTCLKNCNLRIENVVHVTLLSIKYLVIPETNTDCTNRRLLVSSAENFYLYKWKAQVVQIKALFIQIENFVRIETLVHTNEKVYFYKWKNFICTNEKSRAKVYANGKFTLYKWKMSFIQTKV